MTESERERARAIVTHGLPGEDLRPQQPRLSPRSRPDAADPLPRTTSSAAATERGLGFPEMEKLARASTRLPLLPRERTHADMKEAIAKTALVHPGRRAICEVHADLNQVFAHASSPQARRRRLVSSPLECTFAPFLPLARGALRAQHARADDQGVARARGRARPRRE